LIASTPAIKVVLTAPNPTNKTPSLPFGSSISTGDFAVWVGITKFLSERWEGLRAA